jgi:hypothetical protein
VKEKKAAGAAGTTAAPVEGEPGAWSEAAVRVLRKRYLLRDADGKVVETPMRCTGV